MYTYILKILKSQRDDVKRRNNKEFATQKVKINIRKWESAHPLWQIPVQEVRKIVKDRVRRLSDSDLPDGHELEDKEHVRLIVDWDSDKVVFDDEVEVPKPERDRRGRDRARRRF
jgi:hypothetical protein